MTMQPEISDTLLASLARSRFRSSFHLRRKEFDYIAKKGLDTVRRHAEDFVRLRLAPAMPVNDGRQTPMKGHPVFIAQHATATCCRKCLEKWHKIPAGTELTRQQTDYVVAVIMIWINTEIALSMRD
ncbi:MAG TPA: DUF4186 domain-containing protein [Phycisphaerae bacterium]|nr:DUF4186 domain-containing protein [Phycisphaerae bacterium]